MSWISFLLAWEVRYEIALDLASPLLYLHEEREQCVLHRQIKSSNIMLDSSFNAELGNFGLSRLVNHKKGSQTTVIAPEYFVTGKPNKESDIYSFGTKNAIKYKYTTQLHKEQKILWKLHN